MEKFYDRQLVMQRLREMQRQAYEDFRLPFVYSVNKEGKPVYGNKIDY